MSAQHTVAYCFQPLENTLSVFCISISEPNQPMNAPTGSIAITSTAAGTP